MSIEAAMQEMKTIVKKFQAEVRNAKNKLIATATTTFLILQDDMLARIPAGQNSE